MSIDTQTILIQLVILLACFAMPLAILPGLIWGERRVAAWIQLRSGPNRVGPFGLMQPLADVIKLVFKEDVIPNRADRTLFTIAPIFAFVPGMVGLAVVPMGPGFYWEGQYLAFQGADIGVGILFLLAMVGITAYALTFGGWASNSKFPQLGGIRATAQVISYEIALGLAFLSVIIVASDPAIGISGFRLTDVVWDQVRTGVPGDYTAATFLGFLPNWNMFTQPLAFVIFVIAAFAEANRAPFDLPEAEPELVGGFHTEYSSFKFAMFFMGEYLAVILQSCLIVILFMGGWHVIGMPIEAKDGLEGIAWTIVGFAVFMAKVSAVIFFFMWVRWSLPRFRYDQLMNLGWKILIPLALLNLILVAIFSI